MADDERRDVFTHSGCVRFWTASAVSDFGSYITTIALQVLGHCCINRSGHPAAGRFPVNRCV